MAELPQDWQAALEEQMHDNLMQEVAQLCHELNRSYCAQLGDHSQLPWSEAPQWQRDSALSGVKAAWAVLDSGGVPQPQASHESWYQLKAAEGWTWGPVKNPESKQHPCFLPYHQLPPEQQLKDRLFLGVVMAVWSHQHSLTRSVHDPGGLNA